MNDNIPTPETDANVQKPRMCDEFVSADFARSLERRLIEAQRDAEQWKKRAEYLSIECSFALKQRDDQINEVNLLTKRIEMLTQPRPMDGR